jgi:uncharacterized protein DUF6526
LLALQRALRARLTVMIAGMAHRSQSFENHTRLVPWYHVFVFGILTANVVWTMYRFVHGLSVDTAMAVLMAAAIWVLAVYARSFALRAQDRVIRLEMRLRLQRLLAPEFQARIADFTPRQLIAMRFASDGELPELAASVLRDQIQDSKTIKKMIKNWEADYLRV